MIDISIENPDYISCPELSWSVDYFTRRAVFAHDGKIDRYVITDEGDFQLIP